MTGYFKADNIPPMETYVTIYCDHRVKCLVSGQKCPAVSMAKFDKTTEPDEIAFSEPRHCEKYRVRDEEDGTMLKGATIHEIGVWK